MNYKKIHDQFIAYFKTTNPRARLKKRNSNDSRLMNKTIYQEVHHIIPRSLGGSDELNNLVEVLPEEHIFLHMLRYKIYRKREDMLAVRLTLNGYNSNNIFKGKFSNILNKKIRMGYAWLKHHSVFLRKTEGWQTEEGRTRISKARKGTIVVKDRNTNKIIGSVPVNHPNVLSGTWVHHTKGRKISEEERITRKQIGAGKNNNRYCGLEDNYFLEKGVETYKEFGRILSWPEMIRLSEIRNFKWLKGVAKFRFGGLGKKGYYNMLSQIVDDKYHLTGFSNICIPIKK
jgi:hypothetical protein